MTDQSRKNEAVRAFEQHVSHGVVLHCEPQKGKDRHDVFLVSVGYRDGSRNEGMVMLSNDETGYSICIMMTYDPARQAKWQHPHEWHHGFLAEPIQVEPPDDGFIESDRDDNTGVYIAK